MTYKHQLKTSSKNLNADDLKDSLPDCLIKEILYHSNRSILTQLFKGIISENLMRDLAFATTTRIFMPEDVILTRNQQVESICYIVEGTCAKYNKKNKIIAHYSAGDFCGEDALLKDVRPKFTVRAQTFMLMKVIAKSDVDSILSNYPLFYKEFVQEKDESPVKTNIENSRIDNEGGTL
jgi:signal-transduction protein with cAMP-binding, CBS, and nucleotidyltransferase domain